MNKFIQICNKNEGLTTLSKICHVLDGGELNNNDEFINKLTPEEISAYKYAPTTSCDVERSFSAYKRVLEDNRRNFRFENLAHHLIIH